MTPGPIAPLRALGALAILVVALAACSAEPGASGVATEPPASAESPATSPGATSGDGFDPAACPTSEPEPLPAGETRTVTIATELGSMDLEIDGSLSPIAAGNFVALAECGWYDGVVFHRVIPGFVVQGGDGEFGRAPDVDPDLVGTGGPGYTITDEPVTATYGRGVVAMARTAQPNSVGSQFFIVVDDAAEAALADANTYQIIGTVKSGMETADAIVAAADQEIPTDPVEMTAVSVANP